MLTRWLYTLLLFILLPLVPAKLLWRARRQPEYRQHWGERFGFYPPLLTPYSSPLIWLHCVSVGETRAVVPLVALLQERYPQHRILLTHGTPTGRATSEQLFGDKVLRCYLPYDLPFAVGRFLRHFQPQIGLLMETELWFNLIAQCNTRRIPLLLVNARLSEKSARAYAWLDGLTRQGLHQLAGIAAQTEQDAARLRALGAEKVIVTGNLKFDIALPADNAQLRTLFGAHRPIFLAASTRDGEEELILDAVASANIEGLLTVIVPRHPQRFDAVAALLEKRGLRYAKRSKLSPTKETVSVLLGDSMGELFSYYSACDLAFIGGSLLPYGGQNLIEACALGKPVLLGPHTHNFAEASVQAIAAGAALRVDDTGQLAKTLQHLLSNADERERMGAAGKVFAEANRGAAARTLQLIEKLI
ncbi:MAG: lipid IV(A) 3-deoxy-D-manno-octulosonic acid transferase [Methylophilaceae bacterium]